ncbi:TonB-dependent receptor [Shewanella sp. FJAT-52076]|uniref:TonB-dependent receptor n=1 Tax=Shewanella sp. FJAT-52076 TaxID=2864202 RepID=UPI001C65BD1C|nr:TonB-dependent receptor [Shewanella sp. FJAT-52076]QYJ74816.1 TonB-dependent receptor [Shewanella sp. FJAT-52076]
MSRTNFRRTLVAVSVSALFAFSSTSFAASNTDGSIYGKADAGTAITYKNVKTGVTRTIYADDKGRFNVGSVPAGTYEIVNAKGETQTVQVVIGTGTNVAFDGTTEVIQVMGSRIQRIDTSSVESSTVYDMEVVAQMPVARDIVSVALLTPGAVQGGQNFGRNLPVFGGSSIAENGYYIDGMDVTNLRTLLSFANLPQDAVSQTQVKSGGYGVEYGRSLGGIVNIVTRSGSNEWEFGGSAYYTPDALRSSNKDVYDYNADDIGTFNSEDSYDKLEYNVFGSGAIIEDKLFFFAMLQGQNKENDNYGWITSYRDKNDTPNYFAKLNWFITEDHSLRFTYLNNKQDREYWSYDNPEDVEFVGQHGDLRNNYTLKSGGEMMVLGYTGYLTESLTANLQYGTLTNRYEQTPFLEGGECPRAYDNTDSVHLYPVGCWDLDQVFISDDAIDEDERTSWKADFEWALGDHTLRFGYNKEEYEATSPGESYTGGIYYRYFTANDVNGCRLNGVNLPCGTEVVRTWESDTLTATFGVENTAWYIEDNWQVTDNILLYAGIRNETFTNYDANGDVFLESDNLIAPRFGASWDIDGDSTKKLYATLGRYYIPVPANTNIRATRNEYFAEHWYYNPGGFDEATGRPVATGAEIGSGVVDIQVPNPEVIADRNLNPMYQDELIVGYQQQVSDNWTLGAKFMGRKIGDGMDDFCGHDGFTKWAADNGYDNFDPRSMQGCIIVNPGNDITIAMDLEDDGNLTVVTTPNSYHGLPEYERKYLGLELTAERALADGWKANFSYVLSNASGNAEGYVNSSLAQEDPGATQDFDHANFMDGADGDLPTDHTHQFKAYGLYEVTDEFNIGVYLSATSGTPLSCQGYVRTDNMLDGGGSSTAYDANNFKRYSASSFYCLNENGEQELTNRGDYGRTDWLYQADLSFTYRPAAVEGLILQATIFNVFNFQEADTIDQQKDFQRGTTEISENFLMPSGYQTGRSVQFTARYSF